MLKNNDTDRCALKVSCKHLREALGVMAFTVSGHDYYYDAFSQVTHDTVVPTTKRYIVEQARATSLSRGALQIKLKPCATRAVQLNIAMIAQYTSLQNLYQPASSIAKRSSVSIQPLAVHAIFFAHFICHDKT
jgi:hypothetical protein